jgi:hypothetical protein
VGRRLPARRRGGGVSALFAWGRRGAAMIVAALAWRELRRGRELVARACHELRGPLTARISPCTPARATGDPTAAGRLRRSSSSCAAGLAPDDLAAGSRRPARRRPRRGRRRGGASSPIRPPREGRIAPVVRSAKLARRGARRVGRVLPRGDRGCGFAPARSGNLLANALEHGAGGTVRWSAYGSIAGPPCASRSPTRCAGLPRLGDRASSARSAGPARGPPRPRLGASTAEIVTRHGGRIVSAPTRARRASGDRCCRPAAGGGRRDRPGRDRMTRRRRCGDTYRSITP